MSQKKLVNGLATAIQNPLTGDWLVQPVEKGSTTGACYVKSERLARKSIEQLDAYLKSQTSIAPVSPKLSAIYKD